jgi:capsid protein
MWGIFRSLFGGGFDAARTSEDRARSPYLIAQPKDEERHIGYSRDAIRLAAMELDRNHGIFFGANNRIASYSIPRIALRFETSDPVYNLEAEQFLNEWFKVCDVRGRNTFKDNIWLSVRSIPTAGDGGFILLDNGQIQPVESELIRTPEKVPPKTIILDGVEVDSMGRTLAYWVAPRSESGLPDAAKAKRVLARDFVFYRRFYRQDCIRGYPAAACSIVDLEDQKDLHRAYVKKTRNEASQSAVVNTEDGHLPSNLTPNTGANETGADDTRPPMWEGSGLKMFFLKTAEGVTNISPTTPNADMEKFEEGLIRNVCAGYGIPFEFVMLNLTGLSWSTSNAVVKMAGDAFREINLWAKDSIISPIVSWRLMMAIRDGEIPAPPALRRANGMPLPEYNRARFGVPEYLWADEREHLAAAKEAWLLSAKSMDDIAGETGNTAVEVIDAKVRNIEYAMVKARELSERQKQPVSWDQIISAGTPGVVTMAELDKRAEEKKKEKTA